ncbi:MULTISPECIES: hypothetical protein [Streptomyces]|uniref:Uncharacterized protein n=1 Tax=Streptomyces nymphaeiformis TaxID=2663842 RepID=A0A7W7U7N1_9ACTN|nr:hypothetical protein [Streptomyces nymphaeiformis]MBB4986572.1 hypothetical protein [Streptomyces nymphaeiformis]
MTAAVRPPLGQERVQEGDGETVLFGELVEGGRFVAAVLVEWAGGDLDQGNVDVGFFFETSQVTVFNALDENGLSFSPPDQHQRSHGLH